MENFWQKLNKPFFCLAPMEDITDCAFREMLAKYGKPDVTFTEFVCVDALVNPQGFKKFKHHLKFTNRQRPIVAQVWGSNPEKFFKAAEIIKSLKFDGMDINMGCPKQKEIAQKACAHLMREPKLAQLIIIAAKKGAGKMPVSVKTRIGYSKIETLKWIGALLKTNPAAITIHGRTKQEMSKVPAHWDEIAKAVKLRDEMKSETLIIGNGDATNFQDGIKKAQQSGADGIMIGRGAIGNPWVFCKESNKSINEKLNALLEHLKYFEKFQKNSKPFVVMRKFIKGYVSGFGGASQLRAKLMEAQNMKEIKEIIKNYLYYNKSRP
jgi:nifR3 family TIM-barrel protein